jgi:filamentous hemagglutinin family protein
MSPTQIFSNPALPLANKPMCTGKKRQASTLDVPAGFKFRVLGPLYLGLVLALSHGLAKANPQGGQVVAGSASFTFPSERELVINQTSERAILDWQRFSIGAGQTTRFVQPTASSVVLNRVVGGDPSEILGRLFANGQVFLSNPNGILFGPDARVDVHGLVATTHGIRNQDFMAGDYRFTLPGKPESSVVNQGTISIADAGMAALVAPAVRNDGIILARLGQVALASSTGFTLDLYGDRLLELAVDPVTLKALLPDGTPVASLVDNAGQIVADGGAVLLTANAARTVVDKVINVSGLVSARSARMEHGAIVLEGGEGGVNLSGTLDVSAARSDGTGDGDGGTVYVLGERVTLTPSARIHADGGELAGHGGFVETSGQVVSIEDGARVSAVASSGNSGTWLIDPNDITISTAIPNTNITPNPFTYTVSSSADSSFITVNSLLASLNAGTSVVISTGTAGANTQQGNITVANDINKTVGGDATLTLNAHNNIILNASITSSSGKLNMVFNPDSDGNMIGGVTLGNTTLNANGGTISAAGKTVNLPAVAPAPTAIVDSDMTIGTLVLNDGTLNGTGNFTIGTAKLTGGTLGGTGNLTVTPDFDMSGAAILGLTFNNLSLNRTGNFVVPAAGFTALNSVTLNSGGTVTLNGTCQRGGHGQCRDHFRDWLQ